MGCDSDDCDTINNLMDAGTRATHMGCDVQAMLRVDDMYRAGTRATHMGCDCKNNAI